MRKTGTRSLKTVTGVGQGRLGAALAQLVGLHDHRLAAGLNDVGQVGRRDGDALLLGVDPQDQGQLAVEDIIAIAIGALGLGGGAVEIEQGGGSGGADLAAVAGVDQFLRLDQVGGQIVRPTYGAACAEVIGQGQLADAGVGAAAFGEVAGDQAEEGLAGHRGGDGALIGVGRLAAVFHRLFGPGVGAGQGLVDPFDLGAGRADDAGEGIGAFAERVLALQADAARREGRGGDGGGGGGEKGEGQAAHVELRCLARVVRGRCCPRPTLLRQGFAGPPSPGEREKGSYCVSFALAASATASAVMPNSL
jgi:hypothetical protein